MFVFMVRFTGVATLAKAIGKEMKDWIQKRVTHILKITKTNQWFYLATHYKS